MKTIRKISNEIKKVLEEAAEKLDWKIYYNFNDITFTTFSPEGQECFITLDYPDTLDEIVSEIFYNYDTFDVSEETNNWLDNFGHGKNGAPYDMKDVYEDMDWFRLSIRKLYDEISY